jgi:hypothetical protein
MANPQGLEGEGILARRPLRTRVADSASAHTNRIGQADPLVETLETTPQGLGNILAVVPAGQRPSRFERIPLDRPFEGVDRDVVVGQFNSLVSPNEIVSDGSSFIISSHFGVA